MLFNNFNFVEENIQTGNKLSEENKYTDLIITQLCFILN